MPELFIEVGVEDMPARFVGTAVEGLAAGLTKLLGPLAPVAPRLYATPRRFAVVFEDVEPRRPMVEKVVTGPPAAVALKDGAPTPAGISFATKQGVDPSGLYTVDTPKGAVVAVKKLEGGESTARIVADGLEAIVTGIPFKKSMRWGAGTLKFVRPIHYVCAVLGGERIDATVAEKITVDTSVGHWLHHPAPFVVENAELWCATLRNRNVIADRGERRGLMLARLQAAAEELGLEVGLDEDLVAEVVNLVETPTVVVSGFAEALLELPPRLLIESMKVHQRYFPLFRDGKLDHHFLIVSNNPFGDAALIAQGNARVLAARFSDAQFFYAEDRKKGLAEHGRKLADMVWIRGLGSVAQRQLVITQAALGFAALLLADRKEIEAIGPLCRSDLPTAMVGEFPELQGHVGRLLAEAEGIPGALALEEIYLPRFAGDALPSTLTGQALALAERITLLSATFGAGLEPKGSADPLGLRRAAIGLVALVIDAGLRGELATLFAHAGAPYSGAIEEFVLARLRAMLLGEGHPTDLVEAVFATGGADLVHIAERVRGMGAMVRDGTFGPIRVAFRRAAGLVKDVVPGPYDALLFQLPVEHQLHGALHALPPAADVGASLAALTALRPTVDRFFEGVLVMCDDPALRAARLGLLAAVTQRFASLADFTRLSTE